MKTFGPSWRHNLNERTHERVQILLPALPATFGLRPTILRPGNPVPRLPSSDSHTANPRQDGGLSAGVGKNLGDLCGPGECIGTKKSFHPEKGRTETALKDGETGPSPRAIPDRSRDKSMSNARPHPCPFPQGEGEVVAAFWRFDGTGLAEVSRGQIGEIEFV
jgi:hypothetical protein